MFVYHAVDGNKTAYIFPEENDRFITFSPDKSVTDPAEIPKQAFLISKYMKLAKSLETEEDYNKNKDVLEKMLSEIWGEEK